MQLFRGDLELDNWCMTPVDKSILEGKSESNDEIAIFMDKFCPLSFGKKNSLILKLIY